MDHALSVQGVVKRFGGVVAVDDVSLDLMAGQRLAIIGGNGSGKSTLLKVIGGVYRPDRGRILLKGTDVTRRSPFSRSRSGLGMTFQSACVLFERSVGGNVALALQACGESSKPRLRSWRRGVVGESVGAIRESSLASATGTLAASLAYGQQRELEALTVFAQERDVVLLDEPTAGLAKAEVGVLVDRLVSATGDRAVIVVDHDLGFLQQVAEAAVAMHAGKIVASGSVEEVLDSRWVKDYYVEGRRP